MRLRNIPRARETIQAHPAVVKNPELQKGCWAQVFGNGRPVRIEIGMGKGRFIMNMAKAHPEYNFIGIERYSSVLLRAVEKYEKLSADMQKPLPNIRFICMDARGITEVFAPGEVGKIYLNFSDPWPKARHARRRLTSSDFLALYDQILTSDGTVEFKTDNRVLFDFSVEEVKASSLFELTGLTYDLHHDSSMNAGNIMTEYEEKFSSAGGAICKLVAARKGSAAGCI